MYYQSLADESAIPESRYVKGVAGFSTFGHDLADADYFDNLYVYKDTFCFVTSHPDDIGLPEQGAHFVTTGNHNVVGNTKGRATPPDENRWRVLTPADAHKLFGPMAIRNPGTTVCVALPVMLITDVVQRRGWHCWREQVHNILEPLLPLSVSHGHV